MQHVALLTVTDSFQLTGIGLTFMPDFPVPNGWRNRTEEIVVATPDGQSFQAKACFNLTHFNIRDPDVLAERRWRIVVSLPDVRKEQVPIGSRLLVSPETQAAVASGA